MKYGFNYFDENTIKLFYYIVQSDYKTKLSWKKKWFFFLSLIGHKVYVNIYSKYIYFSGVRSMDAMDVAHP